MAENTKIAWCDHTFNSWLGCTKVSEACRFCYAENLMDHRYHRVKWGPTGTRVKTKTWGDPPKWNKQAIANNTIYKVFCCSLADVFEERDELIPWRQELFELIDKCQNLSFLLLTKRPQCILSMWPDDKRRDNIWLGTSIAWQKDTEEFIEPLLNTKHLCKYLFLSVEPQIGKVDLAKWINELDWVISGGESKQGEEEPRPYHVEWARFLRDQCRDARKAFFLKQLGYNPYMNGHRLNLKDRHGGDTKEWPADLLVRECPESYYTVAA